ncbi:hypothetical protein BKA70DRAFT_1262254 [Coprinopsis sp. MPI-PUGE-AT-0042]|nr:hypothetical protein BKA70DRAFT_1262254 [Coprinopsis sp. MPI-PUGE-AT-0042]
MTSTIPESQPLLESESAPSGSASAPVQAPLAAGGSSTSALAPQDFKVYAPANIQAAPLPSLSDEYFTPNAFELKAAQATLSARTSSLVNAPLQVRAHREKAEQAKKDRWPQTTIRVRFPDRTILEKVFPSTSKIKPVYAFVRECLRDDVKPIKFILYQSPPKRDLKVSDPAVRDLSLFDLKLAPASMLLLRFEDESLNHVDSPAPLLPSILSHMTELPVPREPAPSSASKAEGSSSKSSTSSGGPKGEVKVPKWLKLGKK